MRYKCTSCGSEWDYPFEACIFCSNSLTAIDDGEYVVEGITQVFTPSEDHPITPYFVALLRSSDGSRRFLKTFHKYNIGDNVITSAENGMGCTIGVIGTGVTGKGLVELAIMTGNRVILKSRTQESLDAAIKFISKKLSIKMEPDKIENALRRITATTDYDSLEEADLIIESVIEDIEVKRNIFRELDSICGQYTVLASNTSTLPISKIAEGLHHPERVLGMHFFNPIPRMMLLELIVGRDTSDETLRRAHEFAANLNKTAVEVKDISGFVVNRLLFLMINEACRMLDAGIASIEDIDKAMKLGANHPMGPFQLADFIGIDLCLSILEIMHDELKNDSYKPANILHTMVKSGNLGRKTGAGFYSYG